MIPPFNFQCGRIHYAESRVAKVVESAEVIIIESSSFIKSYLYLNELLVSSVKKVPFLGYWSGLPYGTKSTW